MGAPAGQNGGYRLPTYAFVPPEAIRSGAVHRHPVVIAGGGLTGLTLACDLATRGIRAVVLDEDNTVGVRGASSRGICYSQKSLEIFDRLGIYERIRDKGVTWSVGKTLAGDEIVYSFDLQTASASKQPPFINLQQFYLEWFLVDRINELGLTDLRWNNRVTGVTQDDDCARVSIETPQGGYDLEAEWLVDATGVHSPVREGFGLDARFARTSDRWCITDVRFRSPMPAERWTWIEAPFNQNRAVWQHLMADEVWRLDYQMAPDADPEHVSRPEVAEERLREHLGPEVEFDLVWVGPYGYRDALLAHFRHGRVFFIGDAAHVVSPFGARGGNTGIADAENLGWKLALVLGARASASLLESYDAERQPAAAENLVVTRRTNRFLAPHSPAEKLLRDAVIALARDYPFARALVNTGRMSVANVYKSSPALLSGGMPLQNLPLKLPGGREGCLVDLLRGGATHFLALWFAPVEGGDAAGFAALNARELPLEVFACGTGHDQDAACGGGKLPVVEDLDGLLRKQLQAAPGMCFLIRPDMYVGAALQRATPARVEAALNAILGKAGK